jgi:hypothetical protein
VESTLLAQLQELTERVKRLEQQQAAHRKSIDAEVFRVVGGDGKVAATFGFEWAGGKQPFPSLELRHSASNACLSVAMTPAGPSIYFFDEKAVQRINLSCPFGDGPGLDLHDERQTLRARFGVTEHGPGLSLNSPDGLIGTIMLLTAEGPTIQLFNARQQEIWCAPQ